MKETEYLANNQIIPLDAARTDRFTVNLNNNSPNITVTLFDEAGKPNMTVA
jgi:uncharacterized membrane protein